MLRLVLVEAVIKVVVVVVVPVAVAVATLSPATRVRCTTRQAPTSARPTNLALVLTWVLSSTAAPVKVVRSRPSPTRRTRPVVARPWPPPIPSRPLLR